MVEHIKREHPLADRPPHTNAPPMARLPPIQWFDSNGTVCLTLDQENVQRVDTSNTAIHFLSRGTARSEACEPVDLFEPIYAILTTTYTLPNGMLRVRLVKERRRRWPYLFKDNLYRGQTSVDWQNYTDEEEEEEEEGSNDVSFMFHMLDVTVAFQRVLQQTTQGQQSPKGIDPTLLPSHTLTRVTEGMTDNNCAICYERLKPNEMARRLGCGHTFHRTCLDEWLGGSATCPMCRAEVK